MAEQVLEKNTGYWHRLHTGRNFEKHFHQQRVLSNFVFADFCDFCKVEIKSDTAFCPPGTAQGEGWDCSELGLGLLRARAGIAKGESWNCSE